MVYCNLNHFVLDVKHFIFRFHIYFSASFASYFLVSDTKSRTRATISFNTKLWHKSAIIEFVHKIWQDPKFRRKITF